MMEDWNKFLMSEPTSSNFKRPSMSTAPSPDVRGDILRYAEMQDIKQIASTRFAGLINLARDRGLLDAVCAGDQEAVELRASELLAALAEQIHWVYPTTPIQSVMSLEIHP